MLENKKTAMSDARLYENLKSFKSEEK